MLPRGSSLAVPFSLTLYPVVSQWSRFCPQTPLGPILFHCPLPVLLLWSRAHCASPRCETLPIHFLPFHLSQPPAFMMASCMPQSKLLDPSLPHADVFSMPVSHRHLSLGSWTILQPPLLLLIAALSPLLHAQVFVPLLICQHQATLGHLSGCLFIWLART